MRGRPGSGRRESATIGLEDEQVSDEQLRAAERKWRESESTADEALYLSQRIRAGDLSHECTQLAAFLGHAAATTALGTTPRAKGQSSDDPMLARLLDRCGTPVCVRAGLALSDRALPAWTALFPHDLRPQRLIAACRAWLVDPSALEEVDASIAAAATAFAGNVDPPEGGQDPDVVPWQAAIASIAVARGTAEVARARSWARQSLLAALLANAQTALGTVAAPHGVSLTLSSTQGAHRSFNAIAEALLPSLLDAEVPSGSTP